MQLPALQVETDPSQRDAGSRAAAVRALSSVAQELFPFSRLGDASYRQPATTALTTGALRLWAAP